MTNMLVTTERDGTLRYYNDEAARHFSLGEGDVGKPIAGLFAGRLDKSVLASVEGVLATGEDMLGVEGIYKGESGDVDFSLNMSAIGAKRALHDGVTLLFTDQTRERELKAKISVVTEERRLIKDMFSRYLSSEVVQHLIDTPEIVGLGGSDKKATVFFADIRGYTSFSEGRDPQYIVEVLNEYFSEAVEIVIRHNGFIDKFIGDCIMAAWGVPMVSEAEDAIQAVSCALEIQQLIARNDRKFFHGEAEHLRVGFGMHTGHLVAGNLGSLRKMNYSIIGDTVNVAARLEGVAAAGEIIITRDTRDYLGDRFVLEERKPVKVKGKAKEIEIFNVISKR
jgi:class 3 adenylate cyclase